VNKTLRFEVVSIKANKSGANQSVAGIAAGGRYTMRNSWIAPLITTAYPHIRRSEIEGMPDWLESERYDIDARAGREASPAEMQAMLRTLLVERFQWVAHEETRERPVYALRVARADGKLGPDLRRSETNCEAIAAARREGRTIALLPNGAIPCMTSVGTGMVRAGSKPLSELAAVLFSATGRTVIDKTSLSGPFDFALRYNPSLQAGDIDGPPDLFTAIEEQLGLKLLPDRADMPVLVIDRIERPSEN
jgi:uncharacterized protein (TIGR03435 family)